MAKCEDNIKMVNVIIQSEDSNWIETVKDQVCPMTDFQISGAESSECTRRSSMPLVALWLYDHRKTPG
jgi:hypothetical protein